jgi:hypothetical protein
MAGVTNRILCERVSVQAQLLGQFWFVRGVNDRIVGVLLELLQNRLRGDVNNVREATESRVSEYCHCSGNLKSIPNAIAVSVEDYYWFEYGIKKSSEFFHECVIISGIVEGEKAELCDGS